MTSIPQGKTGNISSLPDLQGAWTISQPIAADLHLVQSGNLVEGTYCSTENKGTIKGTIKAAIKGTITGALSVQGDEIIFTGRWADQLGSGDFKVFIAIVDNHRKRDALIKASFQGRWKHSRSRDWDGEFLAEMR
ncbi:MAG TPA: hypothetical protein PKV33_06870 [Methanothrix sp.]|nr:hypothetical protein [Methanothrix sp.]